jgi:hypothetical protein
MTPLVAFAVLAGFIVVLFVGIYWLSTRLDPRDGPLARWTMGTRAMGTATREAAPLAMGPRSDRHSGADSSGVPLGRVWRMCLEAGLGPANGWFGVGTRAAEQCAEADGAWPDWSAAA